MIKKILKQIITYKSIVVLNGKITKNKLLVASKVPIIALDGAAQKLFNLKIKPDFILGDLDSSAPDLFPKIQRIALPDQNFSDFEKALLFLEEQKLLPTLITGLTGGYLDHILNNFIIFGKSQSLAYGENQIAFTLKETKSLSLKKGTKISIFGFPKARITTKGLKWELQNSSLDFFTSNSTFNRTNQDQIEISVEKGQVLVIIYLLPIQDLGIKEIS